MTLLLFTEQILMNGLQRITKQKDHQRLYEILRWRWQLTQQQCHSCVVQIIPTRRLATTTCALPNTPNNTAGVSQQPWWRRCRRPMITTSRKNSERYNETSSSTAVFYPKRRYLSSISVVHHRQPRYGCLPVYSNSMTNNNCNFITQTSNEERTHQNYHQRNHLYQRQQRRQVVSWLPEAVQSISIWGGSGYMLKSLHTTFDLPYWACFAAISIGVRTLLFPLVVYAAQTSARFAKIAPDVQFQTALYKKDIEHYRAVKASMRQFVHLFKVHAQTLFATYKINKVNPTTVFLSPLLQMPIFWYISVDMRKIVNGLDPMLAQSLVENGVAWIPDLTEADPWFGLPVMAGVLLYGNMEVALGRQNMAGEATSKADFAITFKDMFQSLAVFMPCFTAQLPSGVQVYIVTSFCFTLVQSIAMRTESFRKLVGLPSMLTKPGPGRFTLEMMELKKLEERARELRGDGPILGTGVLVHGWEVSFAGRYRPTTIQGSLSSGGNVDSGLDQAPPLIPFRLQTSAIVPSKETQIPFVMNSINNTSVMATPFIHGISAPRWQIQQQQQQEEEEKIAVIAASATAASNDSSSTTTNNNDQDREYIVQHSDDVMELANRGERQPTVIAQPSIKKSAGGVRYKPITKPIKIKPVNKKKRR